MKYKGIIFLVLSNILILLIFINPIEPTKAAPDAKAEVDISASPSNLVFDIEHFKPGDWAIREIVISNNGLQDFKYNMSTHRKSGSRDLFKELILIIDGENKQLYKGTVKDFKGFEARTIKSSGEETFTFRVEFPSHLGNEFQGLETEVEFKFFVQGTLGGLLPVDGPKLPETGTNTFTILTCGAILAGAGLILFTVQRYRRNGLEFTKK
ncbi:cell wall protein [Rossellomorea vietnamensis]|uniref:cell wall protein n=1 Tax=Rossellomorea vietnamensis TaxID=218284 RepID=UPI003CF47F56